MTPNVIQNTTLLRYENQLHGKPSWQTILSIETTTIFIHNIRTSYLQP